MAIASKRKLAGALAVSLGLLLAGCGGYAENRSLYSLKQPVVDRTNYTLDVTTTDSGLPVSEQQRILGWFDAMDLQYGDRVSIDDPMSSIATREQFEDLVGRYGVLVSEGSPVTAGYVQPGQARIVITRSTATVENCPDWSAKMDANQNNATSPGYGCAVNSNLAVMVANPEDLIDGQEGTGETTIVTSTKAIEAYRAAPPTGTGGLAETSTADEGN